MCTKFQVNSYYRSLWSLRTFVNINLCATLLIAQLIFVIGADRTSSDVSDHQLVCKNHVRSMFWCCRLAVLQLPFCFTSSSSLHSCGC